MSLIDIDVSSTNSSRQWAKITSTLRYWFKNRFSTKPLVRARDQDTELILSLTTFKARVKSVYYSIESLFDQDFPAHRIILWLSKDEFSDILALPGSLQRLQKRGLEIRFVEGNIKSYKKLVYAIKEFPEAIIVTVDDDSFYPRYLLDGLITAHKKFPKAIHCYRGNLISFTDAGELLPYQQWQGADTNDIPSLKVFPTGVGGVLYPPNSLDKRVLDEKLFLKLAPSADDIWFKAMAVLAGTPSLRITDHIDLPKVIGSQRESLHAINNRQGANDKQMEMVFQEFSITADTFKN